MIEELSKSFIRNIDFLVGNHCWGVSAGISTGSNINLEFGNKILRNTPVRNEYLSEDQQKYVGEYSLFVTCSWRLETSNSIICSSKESNQHNGPMVRGLRKLIDKKVLSVNIFKPAYDLNLLLTDSLCLKIFCDETDKDDEFDNYSFFTPNHIYTITNRSGLSIEHRGLPEGIYLH